MFETAPWFKNNVDTAMLNHREDREHRENKVHMELIKKLITPLRWG